VLTLCIRSEEGVETVATGGGGDEDRVETIISTTCARLGLIMRDEEVGAYHVANVVAHAVGRAQTTDGDEGGVRGEHNLLAWRRDW
jgi:hypothetical protein